MFYRVMYSAHCYSVFALVNNFNMVLWRFKLMSENITINESLGKKIEALGNELILKKEKRHGISG